MLLAQVDNWMDDYHHLSALIGVSNTVPKTIILIQPQLVPKSAFDIQIAQNKGYYAFPPVGLLYLASSTHKASRDIDIRIVDLIMKCSKMLKSQNLITTFGKWSQIHPR